jgi:hypothetical protein
MLAVIFALSFSAQSAHAHPLHMSYTEIRRDAGRNRLQLSLRVYANDFAAAASHYTHTRVGPDSSISEAAGLRYILDHLQVRSQSQLLSLSSCGVTRAGDMLHFCLAADASPGKIILTTSVMTELFHDQVNVVQSVDGPKRSSRMFVKGDGPKEVLR